MGWKISPPREVELCASSEIAKWSLHGAESSKRKETEETGNQSSTRVKTIFLGPNKIPFSAIFDAKDDLNVITQEIALKAESKISPYTSKSTDDFLKPIGQIKNVEVTTVAEGKFLESEDDLKLYQQSNRDFKDKYKQGRIAEDLEEGEVSENTQRLSGLSILEELNDAYDQICCFSSSTDLFNQNQETTSGLPNDSQNQNGIQKDIPEYEGLEYYVILPMITLEELYDYELDSLIIKTKYLSEIPGSNLTNVDFLELLTTIGIKGNLQNPYWKKPYGYYQMAIERLYHKMSWAQEDLNLDGLEILGGTVCWCDFGYMFIHEVKGFVS
ncbi:hypothetical protein O181_115586 [Austropuccinia psidii MF-1]|uniref:Uncharacterized protein n=1 Tax=Austropuccinia psidii MF-1 TaxID=1389203 RepID=A0A9Q3PWB3_9BASI|nr:hypothetical protein [Austropuccinia psidii MF-1]